MAENTLQNIRVRQRYDTSANWTSKNPVLLKGEGGYESDTGRSKMGDGSKNWNALAYSVDVGGRNLLHNTSSEWTQLVQGTAWYTQFSNPEIILEVGETYTFSIIVEKVSNDTVPINLHLGTGTTSYQKDILGWRMRRIPFGKRVSLTYKITASDLGTFDGIFAWRLRNEQQPTTIRYKEVKLEKGNIATDWTPAPEDIQAELDTKSPINHTHTFASLTSKPTTLSGYGITDGVTGSTLTTALGLKADYSHKHSGADITSGTVPFARLPTGTSSSNVAIGNHTHSQYATSTEMSAAINHIASTTISGGNGLTGTAQINGTTNSITLGKPSSITMSTTNSVTSTSHTHELVIPIATDSVSGLMSTADRTKLDGIATEANNYTHPTTAGNKHIPSGGSSGQYLKYSSSGTAVWSDISIPNATPTSVGGIKLDSIVSTKFLRGDGNWSDMPSGGGEVATQYYFCQDYTSASVNLTSKNAIVEIEDEVWSGGNYNINITHLPSAGERRVVAIVDPGKKLGNIYITLPTGKSYYGTTTSRTFTLSKSIATSGVSLELIGNPTGTMYSVIKMGG